MQKIIILGGGESGMGAAVLAKQQGYEVFLSEGKQIPEKYVEILKAEEIDFEENGHSLEKFFVADWVVKSPGIPEKAEVVQALRQRNIPIVSEIEFAAWFTQSKLIAITGSNGKTTVTALVYHLLHEAGYEVGLGGNIGNSFAYLVAKKPKPLYVLEVSSFQLDDVQKFAPDVAVLTNITEDHLDRYDYQLEKYAAAKFNIGKYQSENQVFIYNLDDAVTAKEMPKFDLKAQRKAFSMTAKPQSSSFIEHGELVVENERVSLKEVKIVGKHNQQNVMAAVLAVREAGMGAAEIEKHLKTFQPIEHRLELVADLKGVRYLNDSKATNVDAAWFALDAMTQPVVWIAGGVDKGNDYSVLVDLVKQKVKTLIILGPYKDKLLQQFSEVVPCLCAASMQEAVALAAQNAQKDYSVLLSPCCASFDLFKNYEDRGRQFKSEVLALKT